MADSKSRTASRKAVFNRHPWWTGLGVAIGLLLLAIFFVLPPALRWGLEAWLESHGRLEAQVEDVDFNLFSGNLVVHTLLTERGSEGGMKWNRAGLEIVWPPFFKKRIRFDDVSLTEASLNIVQEQNGDLYVGGIRVAGGEAQPEKPQAQEDGWEIGFGNIDLQQVRIDYTTPEFTRRIMIRQAHIDPMQSWNPSSEGNFSVDLVVSEGSVQIQGTARPYGRQASMKGRLKAESLPLDWAGPWLDNIQDIDGTFSADTAFGVSMGKNTDISLDGTLTLHQLRGELPQVQVDPLTLKWQGTAQIAIPAQTGGEARIAADGTLSAQSPDVRVNGPQVAVKARSIRIQGDFQSNTEVVPEQAAFLFRGTVQADRLHVRQAEVTLAALQTLTAKQVRIAGIDQLRVDSLSIRKGDLIERAAEKQPQVDAPYALSFGELAVQDILVEMRKKRLDFGAVALRNARGILVRNKDGQFKIFDRLPTMGERDQKPAQAADEPWHYLVDLATIGQNSSLRFVDRSVDPAVDLGLENIQVRVESLNTTTPDPIPIDFQAGLGRYSGITAQGTINPAGKISMDINGEVKQFGLPEVRGYAEQRVGYTIHSGQLYADFHLLVEEGRMDSVVKLFITQLNLEALGKEQLGPLEQELGMPLNSALDLLRDGDGNIRMRLPVTGSLGKPDVSAGEVIAKAVRSATYKAVRTAALSYFAPLGAAYVAGKLAGKLYGEAVALRLKPIGFDAAQAKLDQESKQYLNQVAQKLKDRPKTKVLICGTATPADRKALRRADTDQNKTAAGSKKSQAPANAPVPDDRLMALAENRAENTRTYLVNQGIDSERLVLCAPEIKNEEQARPQVELAV